MEKRQLVDLPNEVLTQVLSNITVQSYLAKIALVSKQFKDLVELQFYRHISLDIRCSEEELHDEVLNNEYAHTTMPSFVRFDRLISNFSVRPDLARQVHTLSLRVHCRLWYRPFAADSTLLNLLPELRVLSLSPPSMHSSVSREDSTITSLRLDFSQVADHYDRDAYSARMHINRVPMHIIARHLSLPKLRKVQVEKALLRPIPDELCHLPPGSSPVDDLRFLECCERKSNRTVAAVLCSIKLLKRFVFEVSSQDNDTAQYRPDSASFKRALTRHQGTIEELAVVISEGPSMIGWTLGPFTQWSSLKLLAIPDYTIMGIFQGTQNLHEKLPPLLEEIQIEYPEGHNGWILPQADHPPPHVWPETIQKIRDTAKAQDAKNMQQLAENKDICFPRLNRVVWWHHQESMFLHHTLEATMDENLPALMEIFLAFEKVGIKFEWVTEALFKNTPFGKRLCEWQE